MAEYIEKAALYRKISELEKSARDRVIRTPLTNMSFPLAMEALTEYTEIKHLVADFLAADVVEVKHGRWAAETARTGNYSHCSVCGCRCQGYAPNYKYCPQCGARMDKEAMDFLTKRLNTPFKRKRDDREHG